MLVWQVGMPTWVPLTTLPDAFPFGGGQPPHGCSSRPSSLLMLPALWKGSVLVYKMTD